jgi:hypothetical protein
MMMKVPRRYVPNDERATASPRDVSNGGDEEKV